jgi:hypothetical protein
MKSQFKVFVALAMGTLLVSGCGTDYRVHSVINTDKPSPMTWEGSVNPFDPGTKYLYINPYTYNPSDPSAYQQILLADDLGKKNHTDNWGYRFKSKSSWDDTYFSSWFNSAVNKSNSAGTNAFITINNAIIETSNALVSAECALATKLTSNTTNILVEATNSLTMAASCLFQAVNDPNSMSNHVIQAINWIGSANSQLAFITPPLPLATASLNHANFAFGLANDALTLCSVQTHDVGNSQKYFEIFAPYYWKASESTNLTGLTDDDRKYYRNELQNAVLRAIKESTEQHLSELKGTENSVNTILGAATIGLAGGASVASATAARALAAAAAGTAGARTLFDDQVYRNTFVESTIALIENDQATFLEKIKTVYQTNNIYNYTVEAGILDAKEYEMRGSFYHGLALLQQAVQNTINGTSNSVPVNQLLQPTPKITNPDSIVISWGTNNSSTLGTNITLSGSGFSLPIWGAGELTPNTGAVAVQLIAVRSDDQMELGITSTSLINTPTNQSFTLTIPYTLQNISRQISLPLTIRYQ